jgi:hypothetical protein
VAVAVDLAHLARISIQRGRLNPFSFALPGGGRSLVMS